MNRPSSAPGLNNSSYAHPICTSTGLSTVGTLATVTRSTHVEAFDR